MISKKDKELAQWAMEYALKNGCQDAKATVTTGSESNYSLRNGKIDNLTQSSENSLTIYLYVDGRFGRCSTNRLNKKELEPFIKNGIDATRYLAKDEARTLPKTERYYKGGKPDLELFDDQFTKINPDDKVALAQAVAEEVMGRDNRIISVESSYGDGDYHSYGVTSNGFEGDNQSSWYSLGSSISMKDEGDARPSGGWWESSIYYDLLPKTNIGRTGLERTLGKIGQKKIDSGKYVMIIEPGMAGQLLNPLLGSLLGNSLQQHNSFLIDKLNQKVASDKLTLMDEPHLPKARGARYFDNEGVATVSAPIFEEGVLKKYFIDTYAANKMKVVPTISSPSLLVMKTGNKDLERIIADCDKAILVTGFNGGNSNSTTGDFSYGVEGFLIENGKRTQPISGMNITGNMLAIWSNLIDTGNDPRLNSSWRIPTLVFDDVNFSGL